MADIAITMTTTMVAHDKPSDHRKVKQGPDLNLGLVFLCDLLTRGHHSPLSNSFPQRPGNSNPLQSPSIHLPAKPTAA
jgi:hypothetical protein